MNRTEKAGWIALGASFVAVLVAVIAFRHRGPGAADREAAHLSAVSVFTAAFGPALQLHESMADGDTLLPEDSRGESLRRAIAPATCSFITKRDHELLIECGGGFRHYGYRVVRHANNSYSLVLEIEEQADRVLAIR